MEESRPSTPKISTLVIILTPFEKELNREEGLVLTTPPDWKARDKPFIL
jgi:hypothetical protein